MDLRKLRHFCAVVEKGNFARASELCHVSQPAISASVAQLEAELGVRLLDRGAYGARPTALGAELDARARTILADVKRTSEEMAALRDGVGGSLRVGIGPLFEHTIMPALLAHFVQDRPGVSVSTSVGVTGQLLDQLTSGSLDFTVSSPTGWLQPPPGVAIEVLEEATDIVVAAGIHPVCSLVRPSLAQLAEYPWIVSAGVNEAARNFFEALSKAGVAPPQKLVRTDSIPILRELVLERGFLCVVSPHFAKLLLKRETAATTFQVIECEAFAFPRRICIGTRVGRSLPRAALEMIELIRSACIEDILVSR